MVTSTVRFTLLGPVGLSVAGRSVKLTGKQRALLGVLLLEANNVVSVERISDRIWSEDPPATAAARVRALVAELRRIWPEDPRRLVTRNPGYLLRVEEEELDTSLFADRVELAARAAREGRPHEALAHYDEALSLWRGAPLADLRGPHAEAEASRFAEYRTAALVGRAKAMLALDRLPEAVAELTRLVAENPLRESLHELLMLALDQGGRAAEALEVYRDFRARLVAELGMEPTAELQELHRRVLAGGAEPKFPRMSAEATVPRQLPAVTGRFVGRQAELKQMDTLTDEHPGVLLVVGPAGSGKTALALRWAHRMTREFPDGQLFLSMRGFDPGQRMSPAEALPLLLQAFGRPADDIPVDLQAQTALYRSLLAERRVLVLLDNVANAEQVRPLLPGGPGCLVLVTSRDRLGGLAAREGAAQVTVDALEPQEALSLLARVVGDTRLQAEPEAAMRLAAQCGYMPLALSIAGGRLADQRYRTVGNYVDEMAHRGRLTELRVAGDEHTAVRAALDLSYRVLPQEARRMFRLLSLAPPGGLTTAAAAALAGVDRNEAADLLDTVACVHLTTEVGASRFSSHDLLLEYAAERGGEEDGPAEQYDAVRRLMGYYLASVIDAARACRIHALLPPPDPVPPGVSPESFADRPQALAWLDRAWGDITAAVLRSAELDSGPMAWLMVSGLQNYLHHFRPLAELMRLAEVGLAGAERADDLVGMATMHLSLGNARWRMGQLIEAKAEFEQALALARRAGFVAGEADALRGVGVCLKQLGNPRQAVSRYRTAIRLDHVLDNTSGEVSGLNNLASAWLTLGRLRPAEDCLTACLPLAKRTENYNLLTIALVNLGLVRQEQGRLAEALGFLDRSLAVARAAGLPYGEAIALETVGRVHNDAGRWSPAAEAHRQALVVARQVENLNCQVDTLVGLAAAETGLGRAEHALDLLEAAAAITDRTGHSAGRVELLVGLARANRHAGRPEQARAHVTEALRLAIQGHPLALARAHHTLAEVLLELGDGPGAVQECRRAFRVCRRSAQRLVHAQALVTLGHARRVAGNEAAARAAWGRAHLLFAELGIPRQEETAALLG